MLESNLETKIKLKISEKDLLLVEFKLYVEEKRLCRQDLNTCIVTGDANKIMQGGEISKQ